MYTDSSKILNEKEEAIEETKTRKADMQTQKIIIIKEQPNWDFDKGINSLIESILSSVQFSRSVMSDSLQPHESQHLPVQASLSITNSQSLLKLVSIESVIPSSRLILYRPLLLLPPISPSIRSFPVRAFQYHGQLPIFRKM